MNPRGCGVGIALFLGLALPAFAQNRVEWANSWPEAIAEATARNVPIFLTIQQDENPGSSMMEGVFKDASFIKASQKVVCVIANGQQKHGSKNVVINKQKVAMCRVYDGITCEVHIACNQQAIGNFFQGNMDIPCAVWCMPDGKKIFIHTGPNGSGGQTVAELIKDMDRALDRVPGAKVTKREYDAARKFLDEGNLALGEQDYKKAIEAFQKVKDFKAPALAKQGTESLTIIDQIGAGMVAEAEAIQAAEPKRAKETLSKVSKQFKGLECAKKAEDLLKAMKEKEKEGEKKEGEKKEGEKKEPEKK